LLKKNNWFLVLALFAFVSGKPVGAQDLVPLGSPDSVQDFAQSDTVFLPATTDDLGALPYRIQLTHSQDGFNSVAGLLSGQVGWGNDLGQGLAGLRVLSPGLLFEGVAYPLANRNILNWMPALGSMEFLNFPAQAWWGPEAAAGAIQFREPELGNSPVGQLTLWGGTGGFGDFFGKYSDSNLAITGDYRHSPDTDFSDTVQQTFAVQAKTQLLNDDEWNIHAGFLGAQNETGDNWYSWVGDLQWSDQNFQSIRLRPYFQTARAQNQQADEFGSRLDYDVDLAGALEGNWALGFSHLSSDEGKNEGYIQNTDLIDVLGDFTLNAAFRIDFSSVQNSNFSTLLGLQYNLGIITLLGDYATGLDPLSGFSIQQEDLGAKIHLETKDELDLLYNHQYNSQVVLNGGTVKFMKGFELLDGPVLEEASLDLEAQWLKSIFGQNFGDVSFEFNGRLFRSLRVRINARVIQDAPWVGTASLAYPVEPQLTLFITGQNLGNNPVSWPESDFQPGFNLMGGMTLGF
jgi:hypothetical protein